MILKKNIFFLLGIGVGLIRDTSTIMVGQYFKRRRNMVEILVGRRTKYFVQNDKICFETIFFANPN